MIFEIIIILIKLHFESIFQSYESNIEIIIMNIEL